MSVCVYLGLSYATMIIKLTFKFFSFRILQLDSLLGHLHFSLRLKMDAFFNLR